MPLNLDFPKILIQARLSAFDEPSEVVQLQFLFCLPYQFRRKTCPEYILKVQFGGNIVARLV